MKTKKFIKKAIYPGGINQLRKFIKENLIYPKEALNHNIEGNVLLKYKVNSLGKTLDIHIINGIGYGCNKEAIRLIKILKYTKLLNRKVRVTTNKTITIKFRLPKKNNIVINYEIIK